MMTRIHQEEHNKICKSYVILGGIQMKCFQNVDINIALIE